jgi:uncharacterized membrane protein
MLNLKKIFRMLFGIILIMAGAYHFINPEFYYPMFPPYFVWIEGFNVLAGIAEIILGAGLIFNATQKKAAYGIIGLMILFIPIHIYMIQVGGCLSEAVCLPLWGAWVRLVVIHPVIIAIAWYLRK